MARMTAFVSSILPCQEAFLVDAPTPSASPHRWIQAYGPYGVAGESLRVLSHSHGLRFGQCASSPRQPQHLVVWVWWGSRSV